MLLNLFHDCIFVAKLIIIFIVDIIALVGKRRKELSFLVFSSC